MADDQRVTIESLAAGGDGVGHLEDGRVVFVSRTAVGDVVDIALSQEKKSFARGEVRALVTASPDRVEPGCDLFARGSCGGCQWLHLSADAQRAAKMQIVTAALRHAIASGLEVAAIESPTPALRWRRRARFHWFRPRGSDAAVVGFVALRSRRVFELGECLQLEDGLEAVAGLIQRVLAPHLHKSGEIDVLRGDDGATVVAVRGPVTRRGLDALASSDGIAGVSGRHITYGVDAVKIGAVETTADGFAQASHSGNQALAAVVADWVGGAERVLELFAGSGSLTAAMAPRAGSVLAVERAGGPSFAADNVTWSHGDAAHVTAGLAAAHQRFDVVVLDPPRTGATECVEPLIALTPPRIIYVSCDPATLARDIRALAAAGYRASRAQPLDLMPQTSHVEVVLELVLGGAQ